MHSKVPNFISSNSFNCADSYDESSDSDEIIEYSSESEIATNDFSEYIWMENEDEFEDQVFQNLEEEELIIECKEMHEAMNELDLLDEIRQTEEEIKSFSCGVKDDVAQKSSLNPEAKEFIPLLN